ncbi:MAG: GGDEF domain-containing protein [Clostridia bacterium]|nr:GGDEF domain-containing protein [Clostridia bacterium]
MLIKEFISNNYVMLFELVGILLMLRISAHISSRMKKLTIVVILLLFVETVFYNLEAWTQTFDELSILRPLLLATVYSLYPVIIVFLTLITATSFKPFKKWQLVLLALPELICIPIYYTSQWTHLVCWYADTNVYKGGPLSRLPYIVFAFYFAIFLISNIAYFRKYSFLNKIVPLYIIFGSGLGVILFIAFELSGNYSTLFISGILLYYLCIYIHISRVDTLTSLYNRQSYYLDITDQDEKITGVVSVDMNELKYINDSFGHEAGDDALRKVSAVLKDYHGEGGTVYRVGGDEFIILYRSTPEEDVFSYISKMREMMDKTAYTCAFGYSAKSPDEGVDRAVCRADAEMYADKEEIKRKMAEAGKVFHSRD